MILNRLISVLLSCVIVLASSCQGTHGSIQSYSVDSSKDELVDAFIKISEMNSQVEFEDKTDRSGMNRPSYADISIKANGTSTLYKLHFYGGEKYWENHPDSCVFSIIRIGAKYDKSYGWFSSEKRRFINLFESEIIPLLEERIGSVKRWRE